MFDRVLGVIAIRAIRDAALVGVPRVPAPGLSILVR